MKRFIELIKSSKFHTLGVPLALGIATFTAYGMFFWQLGFYWDDFPISWIRYQFGLDALRLYFSTSRPVWGELYQITTRVLPQIPMYWQLSALVWRWLGVVVLWMIARVLWPGRRRLAFVISVFFLLYPGFNLQWVSFLSSHFFIVLFFFLFSYLLMLWSLLSPHRYFLYAFFAVLFSALNLWMMEYFYALELIRPVILLYFVVHNPVAGMPPAKSRIFFSVLKHWTPYLAVFGLNVFYRMFIFTNLAYQNVLFSEIRADPLAAVLALAGEIAADIWRISITAWAQVFDLPGILAAAGPRTMLYYAAVILVAGFIAVLFLITGEDPDRCPATWLIGLGLVAMLAGGLPFWLAKLEITLGFPASRFTISFMLGVSLFLAGLIELLPSRIRIVIPIVLISLAAGRQSLWADGFRRDWISQKSMFWQMYWRAPGLRENTLVLMNEELAYYADNSLSAALNWIYAPDNHTDKVDFVLFYPRSRLGSSLPALEAGVPVSFTYLVGEFEGSTSQTVVFYYAPPRCLRLLDPEIDSVNRLILDDTYLRKAAPLSSTTPILTEAYARMPEIFGPEPAHGWCYYFQKADLARQVRNWSEVVALGEVAFKLNDYPNDPLERFVFIEGYAHTGDWEKAVELSITSFRVSKSYMAPPLCILWDRIGRSTVSTPERDAALVKVLNEFECSP